MSMNLEIVQQQSCTQFTLGKSILTQRSKADINSPSSPRLSRHLPSHGIRIVLLDISRRDTRNVSWIDRQAVMRLSKSARRRCPMTSRRRAMTSSTRSRDLPSCVSTPWSAGTRRQRTPPCWRTKTPAAHTHTLTYRTTLCNSVNWAKL